MPSKIKNVAVIGAGTMGLQIAFRCAQKGFDVTLHDNATESLRTAHDSLTRFGKEMIDETEDIAATVAAILQSIRICSVLTDAVKDCDLVCETISENFQAKTNLFLELATVCPEKAIFATNSSSFIPSMFAEVSGRADRLLALHFHTLTSRSIVDVMPHARTSKDVSERVFLFAKEIGQIPILLKQEHVGYIFNRLLWAINDAALDLCWTGWRRSKTLTDAGWAFFIFPSDLSECLIKLDWILPLPQVLSGESF